MTETPLFFANGSENLFGIHYLPQQPDYREAFIFVDAFAEEKLWAKRVMVSYARQLVAAGYGVFRFDFRGHGDSDGAFADADVESRLSDITAAAACLRERSTAADLRISLLGLRFGATLAALAAQRLGRVARLILWEPVVDGEAYLKEMLRSNLVTQTAVYKEIRFTREDLIAQMQRGDTINIDGYQIGYRFYEEACAINVLQWGQIAAQDALVVQIGRRVQALKKPFAALQEGHEQVTAAVVEEDPFWKEIRAYYGAADNLFIRTSRWLNETQRA